MKSFKGCDNPNPEPRKYECDRCGAKGCKLWREYQTFADHTALLCFICACKDQNKKPEEIHLRKTDQIGWLVPAVPVVGKGLTEFWGYTSVPDDRLQWWDSLPLFSDRHTSYKQKHEDQKEFMLGEAVLSNRGALLTWALVLGGWSCKLSAKGDEWMWSRKSSARKTTCVFLPKRCEDPLGDATDELLDAIIETPGCPKHERSNWLNLREMDRTHPDERPLGTSAPDVSHLPFREN